jgi:hypothetical protein
VDRIEHNENINDKIIADLRACQFVVADFTGHKGGVYFEAGFRTRIRKTSDLDVPEERLRVHTL